MAAPPLPPIRRWILDFAEGIERWGGVLRRFLPWTARGEADSGGAADPLWGAFTDELTAVCRLFDTDGLGTGGPTDRALTERFVEAAMGCIEPLFAEQVLSGGGEGGAYI